MPNCSDPSYAAPNYPILFDVTTVTPYVVDRSAGKTPNVFPTVVKWLQVNRLAYCINAPGDCGQPSPVAGMNPYGIAQAGTGIGAGTVGLLGSSAIGILPAATAGLAVGILAPIGVIIGIAGGIVAHHAAAVANEHKVLCTVTLAYNQFADNVEAALKAKSIALQDAVVALQNAYTQLSAMANSIYKQCNAACYYLSGLDSLLQFNKRFVYPQLSGTAMQTLFGTPAMGTAPIVSNAQGVSTVPTAQLTSNGIVPLVVIGAVGAKIAGVY